MMEQTGPAPIAVGRPEDADALPPPEVVAREIVDDLQAALLELSAVADALEKAAAERGTLVEDLDRD